MSLARSSFNSADGRPLIRVDLRTAQDVGVVRQRARQFAALAGVGTHDQAAFAAAVSEVARNAIIYAGGGWVEFHLREPSGGNAGGATNSGSNGLGADEESAHRPAVVASVCDRGPGIADVGAILAGRAGGSDTAPAHGLIAAKRLSDEFSVHTIPAGSREGESGTRVTIVRHLSQRSDRPHVDQAKRLATEMARLAAPVRGSIEEAQDQNRELLMTLDALRSRQGEIERLNAELAETNRGVLALYAELDEKAESLQRASELKTRFLSDMTHELRTPLNAMISLSGLLLDRVDGELTSEQEKQVSLINRSATSLGEMVNDLLDIARIEAGKTDIHLAEFSVADVLTALRGIFRPLVPEDSRVQLYVDPPGIACPATFFSDERKLSQIMRNLISNALKFTERGEVRVSIECAGEDPSGGTMVSFIVADTGIGIAAEDLPRIFHDFTQIDSPIQRRLRGTGLGLPLTRKLARLLGGDVTVASQPRVGSTFTLTIPTRLPSGDAANENEGRDAI